MQVHMNDQQNNNWWNEPDPVKALDGYLKMRNSLYYQNNVRSVKKLIPIPHKEETKALDYGCGGGEMTVYMAESGYKVWACDSSPCSVAACRENLKRTQLQKNAEVKVVSPPDYWADLPNDFDLIVAKDVIEHIENDEEFIKEAAAHISEGGIIILTTQNSCSWNYNLESEHQIQQNPAWCGWNPGHLRFYNSKKLSSLLSEAGLEPLKWRATYLFPYMAFQGIMRRARNLFHKAGLEKAFYWPDKLLGGIWPFNRWGWSIQVKARKKK